MLKKLLFRNFRFLYRLSQWLRHRLTPGGSLIFGGLIAAGIFGIDTRQSLAFQVFAICAALMLAAMLSALTFRQDFRLRRLLPDYATAGRPCRYRLRVENPGRRRQDDLLLMDELETRLPDFAEFRAADDPQDRNRNWLDRAIGYPRLIALIHRKRGAAIPVTAIPSLPPRDHRDVEVQFIPARRGYLHFSGARVARPDPLGLFRAIQARPLPQALLVLPRTYRVPKLQLPGRRKYRQGGLNLASHIGDSQEFLSLREYQPGDPLRTIHWRSYAKYGEPIVKEYQDEYFVRQGLVLDTFLENRPPALFEEAVSAAASFQLAMQEQDSLLDLMFVGDRAYRFSSGRGFGQAANMLEILACVQPCRESSFPVLETLLARHAGELSGLVVVLLGWDAPRRRLIGQLTGAGVPVVVFVVTDSDGQDGLDPGPLRAEPERLVVLPVHAMQAALDAIPREVVAA